MAEPLGGLGRERIEGGNSQTRAGGTELSERTLILRVITECLRELASAHGQQCLQPFNGFILVKISEMGRWDYPFPRRRPREAEEVEELVQRLPVALVSRFQVSTPHSPCLGHTAPPPPREARPAPRAQLTRLTQRSERLAVRVISHGDLYVEHDATLKRRYSVAHVHRDLRWLKHFLAQH